MLRDDSMNLLRLCFLPLFAFSAFALEPWADGTLPVATGLEVWLDLPRQNAAREHARLRPLHDDAPIDFILDASGKRRSFVQPILATMPRFHTAGSNAWIHLDGADDFLGALAPDLRFTNATILLVASPRKNPGGFRAFFSAALPGRNDYTHGLNIDLGAFGGAFFNVLNVEGAGAGGMANLLKDAQPFERYQTIAVTIQPEQISVTLNGKEQASRQRTAAAIEASQLFLGARYYSNTADPRHVSGFLACDLAELLVFSRVLSAEELRALDGYLRSKHGALFRREEAGFDPRLASTPPPPVQMLVPGFVSRELPLSLPNINCVRYRPDGKAVALAYDGRVFLLSDSDGDGVEDRAEAFWSTNTLRSPIGMALTPPGYRHGQGLFVAAKGKLALIVDTNADDRADREMVIATGWKELPHGVDALGVAIDAEQNIYFGLGATDFTNPYQVDPATRRPRYSLADERGTILKVSADFQTREIVCTGIRFPVALAFNSDGELFCTDQEGATWLANGNPFDELLHIQRGRHYGFPPRHPRYLPGVIDEPSTYDYEPQHQSTCGLVFNDPSAGGSAHFGPPEWRGDAIVTGYSRGKLYRTKLVRTPAGYVAQNQLIGAVNALAVDACVTPRGDLLLATHSGQPDWGSGPTGLGKLYQVRYTRRDLPRPVAVWPASPTETRIAFDRPLSLEEARLLSKTNSILAGKYIDAGARYESLRPGYQVVIDQMSAPRKVLPVLATELNGDRTTLTLRTAPRTEALQYAVTLSGFRNESQEAYIDLAHGLHGVGFAWSSETNSTTGWLPTLDLQVARQLQPRSRQDLEGKTGTLQLHTQLDLSNMLRPEVQPGSAIDYQLPPENLSLSFRANAPFRANNQASRKNAGVHELVLSSIPASTNLFPLEVALDCRGAPPELSLTWSTAEDPRPRALPLRRAFLPWATRTAPEKVQERVVPEIAGARWLNGRRLFFSETAACYRCHTIRGEGHRVGPDLSNLVHRDYASVRKDILQPNAALNPDHLAYEIETMDGEELSGVILAETSSEVVLARAASEPLRLKRASLKSLKPSAISLMPEGIENLLSPADLADLLAFVLHAPIEPAPLTTGYSALPRPARDLPPVSPGTHHPPLRITLVSGPKDHGPDEHDYPLFQQRWTKLLALAENVHVTTAPDWPSNEQLESSRVLVFFNNNPGWSATRAEQLRSFQKRGGGLVYLHYAVDGHKNVADLSDLIGLAWKGGASKFRHGELTLDFTASSHPITAGFQKLDFHDESYWQLLGDPKSIQVLATGIEDSAPQPLLWVRENGPGRVFVSILGHYTWTFDDPAFRLLLLRAIAWTGHQPVDRLAELATVGARVAPDSSKTH